MGRANRIRPIELDQDNMTKKIRAYLVLANDNLLDLGAVTKLDFLRIVKSRCNLTSKHKCEPLD